MARREEMVDLYGIASVPDVLEWVKARGVTPLFLCVTGSHMWGLNRPDSDLDIRGIYVVPTEQVLALHPGRDTIEGQNELGGLVDLQLYELKKALGMLMSSNGNIVEMLLSPTTFYSDNRLIVWRDLGRKFLTRKLARYYEGYYHSQRKRALANRGSKALVYTYREIMAGIWLMRTGLLVHDFHFLRKVFEGVYGQLPLLDMYMENKHWREPMTASGIWEFELEWSRLVKLLYEVEVNALLPDFYDGYAELNNILLSARQQQCQLCTEVT